MIDDCSIFFFSFSDDDRNREEQVGASSRYCGPKGTTCVGPRLRDTSMGGALSFKNPATLFVLSSSTIYCSTNHFY